MSWLSTTLRLWVALVCLLAAAGKAHNRQEFAEFTRFLGKLGIPDRWVGRVGAGIVLAELSVAGLAPWPATGWLGAGAGAALFAVFTGGVAWAVSAGRVPPCRCFGASGVALNRAHVVRNALLTTGAAIAAIGALLAPATTAGPGLAVAVASAVALIAVVLFWDDLVSAIVDDVVLVESSAGRKRVPVGEGSA